MNENSQTEQIEIEYLKDNVKSYLGIMKSMKAKSVRSNGGPTDIGAVVCLRYMIPHEDDVYADGWGSSFVDGDDMGRFVVVEFPEGKLIEDVASLTSFAGEHRRPSESMLDLLKEFYSKRKVFPHHVALLGDSIAAKEIGEEADAEFEDWIKSHDDWSAQEIFMNDPFASKYLSEALSVMIMDDHGRMARTVCRYSYGEEVKPPMPTYEEVEVEYLGLVQNQTNEFVVSQRVIRDMVLFYAMCEDEEIATK